MNFWYSNPWLIALLSAHYVCLSIPAWGVLLWRLASGRFSRLEWGLLAAFAVCIGAELFQLSAEAGAQRFGAREHWSLSRYFGTFAPLLWVWLAIGLRDLWSVRPGRLRVLTRTVAIAYPLVVLCLMNVPFFFRQRDQGPAADYCLAAIRAAPFVRETWKGPARHRSIVYSTDEYYTARRPACFDDWAALAWWSDGQSEGANLGHYPFHPDYLLLNENSGYRGGEAGYDVSDYQFVGAFKGTHTEYGLFKRKVVTE